MFWLTRKLIDTSNLLLRDVPLQVSDLKFKQHGPRVADVEEYLVDNDHYRTLGCLIDGYETAWRYTPFLPSKIGGIEHCLGIEIPDPNFRPMALPFSQLVEACVEMQKVLATP